MQEMETDRLLMKAISLEDWEEIEAYASDYDMAKTTLNIPHPYPKGSGKDFARHMAEQFDIGKHYTFSVFDRKEGYFIGLMGLGVNKEFHHAELGYWIGKPFWGKGIGTEAAAAMMKYGFHELNLHRIFARAFAHNPGSYRIMEKIGMNYEGTFKEHVYRFGEYADVKFYGLLKRDYLNQGAGKSE